MRSCKRLVIALLLSFMLFPIAAGAARSGSSTRHGSSRSSPGTTHVRGYVRKDGTYVRPHERRSAGSVVPRSTLRIPSESGAPRQYSPRARLHETFREMWGHGSAGERRPDVSAPRRGDFYGLQRDSHGRVVRSEEARDAFKRMHPCPSTGRSSGPCPGYIIDHVKALKHGGLDDPSNMQWQTVGEARLKDRWE